MFGLNFESFPEEGYRILFDGFLVTCQLALWSLAFASCIGVLLGVIRWLHFRWLEPVLRFYVEFSRNTPPLVQILFWYFSASALMPDVVFKALRTTNYEFAIAVIAFSFYHGAFMAEIVRSGLNSVSRGQYLAGRALGLSFTDVMSRIALPQAIRITMPALINEAVSLTKNTSLALAIGVAEMTYQYRYIDIYWFRGVEALVIITVLYLFTCLVISGLGNVISARMLKKNT